MFDFIQRNRKIADEKLQQEKMALMSKVDDLQAEVEELREKRIKLEDEVAILRSRRKVEEQEIQHMVRMREERQQLELDRKLLDYERAKNDEIAKVKEQYRDKTEAQLNEAKKEMRGMYSEILNRLPNVTAAFEHSRKTKE